MPRCRCNAFFAVLCLIPFALPAFAQTSASPSQWNSLVDDFLDQELFPNNPTLATQLGVHDFDAKLEDFSRNGIERHIAGLKKFEARTVALDPKGLSQMETGDREMLLSAIRSELLSLQVIRTWEKDPDTYSTGAANSIYVIMSRNFASPDDRLRSVVAREKQFPQYFASARANLKNAPKIYTEIALEQLPGTVDFFEKDVPTAFIDAHDSTTKADFAASNAAAVASLRAYENWLKSDLLPRSNGDFRIGAETFSKKLLYDDMVATPLDRLLEIGMADLHKNQAEFTRLAHELDPAKPATDVLALLQSMHPAPDQLMQKFRETFDGLIAFINEHHIITLPSDRPPTLQETPPFERATTMASMDTPGPFEKVATEAYFNVTLPGPHDSLEEGYAQPGVGAKDLRESRLIRLGQLQDALLRDARFVAGIQMHRGTFTLEQARQFFVKEGFQSPKIAEIETKRGTADPTYLYYTLGKLQIMKLREDLRKKQGAAFSLGKFHDDFMSQGYPPIAIVRRVLLGDNSPTL